MLIKSVHYELEQMPTLQKMQCAHEFLVQKVSVYVALNICS